MLFPKKVKHRKWHKGRVRGSSSTKTSLAFGSYGIKALETKWITARQIEASRRAITRFIQRGGKLWIRIFPDHPVTIKGSEVPMGGGKGSVDHYVSVVQKGTILFELDGILESQAMEAFRLAGHKLPVKTKFIKKHNI